MDIDSTYNLPPILVNGLFWTVIAISASCVFSVAFVYIFCRFMKYFYGSPYEEEIRNSLQNVERINLEQSRQINLDVINV